MLVALANEQAGCLATAYGRRVWRVYGESVAAENVAAFVDAMRTGYLGATGIAAEIYVSRASAGAGAV